jgi:RND family efflux transporter MFP subunit
MHSHAQTVQLTATQINTAGITTAEIRIAEAGTQLPVGNLLQLNGRVVLPNQAIELISTTVSGKIQAVLVNVGETVRPGTALLKIYSPEFLTIQREYLEAHSLARLSGNQLKRDEALYQDGIIAARRLEDARSHDLLAQATLREHRQLLKLAGMSDSAINSLTSASNMSPTITLNAQRNGAVLEQHISPGDNVEAGAALLQLGNIRTLWVELQASQAQLAQLQLGDAASINGCGKSGKLIAISPQVSRDTQTAFVRAEFTDPGTCMRPNQYVVAKITTRGTNQPMLSVPASALVRNANKDYVFVKTATGFSLQEVQVRARQADKIWLSRTLPDGTLVAVTGLAALRGAVAGLGPETE